MPQQQDTWQWLALAGHAVVQFSASDQHNCINKICVGSLVCDNACWDIWQPQERPEQLAN
jgi:hypothetical protein